MRNRKAAAWRSVCCFIASAMPLLSQKPVISPGGVVNAASLTPVDQPIHGIAPGSIASIFGQNLAQGTASAQSSPLPFRLNGTSVTVDGIAAPLFYVSPTQINFQVPSSISVSLDLFAYSNSKVVVATAVGVSDPAAVDTYYKGFGVFTLDGSGCGRGAILNINTDGTLSLNSPSNSAAPGSYISIFATGLGQVANPPPDGTPAVSSPLSTSNVFPPGPGFWAGRAPGLVGVDQINELLPATSQEGCAVPVAFGPPSRVALSIHAGVGQCVDGPSSSLGQILVKTSKVMNDSSDLGTFTFRASFSSSPYVKLASPPVSSADILAADANAVCTPPGSTMLDAGVISIQLPGAPSPDGPLQVGSSSPRGNLGYRSFAGPLQEGTLTISSPGGKDVGTFQVSMPVPEGITILSNFPKGTVFPISGSSGKLGPPVINWTGGAAGQVVTLKAILHLAGVSDIVQTYQFPATAREIAFIQTCPGPPNSPCRLVPEAGGVVLQAFDELDLEFGPDPAALPTFSAAGLTLGGLAAWTYEYRFPGLVTTVAN